NHRANEMQLADSIKLPKGTRVEPFGPYSGRGEDNPIHEALLTKNGWMCTGTGKVTEHKFSAPLSWSFDPPEIWSKKNPVQSDLMLHSALLGIHMREGPWRVLNHSVAQSDQTIVDLGQSDWADWDHNGDLLYGRDGCLFRRK